MGLLVSQQDRTLLHNAAISGNLELTEAIVAGCVDIDKIDKVSNGAVPWNCSLNGAGTLIQHFHLHLNR